LSVSANAVVGAGGNITLVADNFIMDTESSINATSERGIDSTVEIGSPNQAVHPSANPFQPGSGICLISYPVTVLYQFCKTEVFLL
jgi:hypothetical protein|tara:strand:+ start:125 stop:382 length:258 start_codon:yes stop_codon:yes gene_type:complete